MDEEHLPDPVTTLFIIGFCIGFAELLVGLYLIFWKGL